MDDIFDGSQDLATLDRSRVESAMALWLKSPEPKPITPRQPVPEGWWEATVEGVEAANREALEGEDAYVVDVMRDDDVAPLVDAAPLGPALASLGSDLWIVDRPEWITYQRYYTAHRAVAKAKRAARYKFTYQLSQERLAAAAASRKFDSQASKEEMEAKMKAESGSAPSRLRSFVLDVATHKHNVWTHERAAYTAAVIQRLAPLLPSPPAQIEQDDGQQEEPEMDKPWVLLVVPHHMLPYIQDEWRGAQTDDMSLAKLLMTDEGERTPAFTRESIARRKARKDSPSKLLPFLAKSGAVSLALAVATIDLLSKGIL